MSLIFSLQCPNRVRVQTHKLTDVTGEYAIIIIHHDAQMVENFKLSKKSFLSHLEPQMVTYLKVIIFMLSPTEIILKNPQTFSTLTFLLRHFSDFTQTLTHSKF